MRRWVLALAMAIPFAVPGSVVAQPYPPDTLSRPFRIDFQTTREIKGTVIDGYVYNDDLRSTGRLSLRIEQLDVSGKVRGTTSMWVGGVVLSRSRAYFRARVPDASSYRVQVESFEWILCGD